MRTNSNHVSAGIVFFFTLIAFSIRIIPAFSSSIPLNDGGLFYIMIRDLQSNHFSLPTVTSYNFSDIPFAYPPFAFFVTGFLSSIFGVDSFLLLRLLPPLISASNIPLFYSLSKRITISAENSLPNIFSTLIFSFTPIAFEWQVMGGGITRSLGQTFAIISIIFAMDFYREPRKASALRLAISSAFVVMTHPEGSIQTAIGIMVIIFVIGRSAKYILPTFWILLGVILISSPWWVTILINFGIEPILAAFKAANQDGGPFLIRLLLLFQFKITEEPYITLAACLGLIGMFISISRRDYFLPAWMLCSLLIDPRGGIRFAILPLALLAGRTLTDLWCLLGNYQVESAENKLEKILLGSKTKQLFFGYLFIALLLNSFTTMQNIYSNQTVTKESLDTMLWLRDHTPTNSKIITLTGGRPLLDSFTEWLPALSQRQVITSIFGYEWVNDGKFGIRAQSYRDIQDCVFQDDLCILNWMTENQRADYLVISPSTNYLTKGFPLQVWLNTSPHFYIVYENKTVKVYKIVN